MLFIPSWYTGRAFKPVEEGGQDPTWEFGMLRYPLMEGAQAPDTLWTTYESGYTVLSSTKHPEVAKDILAFASQPKYGALWTAVTNIPSAIKFDPEQDWPSDDLLEELGVEPGKGYSSYRRATLLIWRIHQRLCAHGQYQPRAERRRAGCGNELSFGIRDRKDHSQPFPRGLADHCLLLNRLRGWRHHLAVLFTWLRWG